MNGTQQKILDYLHEHFASSDAQPSNQDIAAATGLHPKSVSQPLMILWNQGYLDIRYTYPKGRRTRRITLTGKEDEESARARAVLPTGGMGAQKG